MTRRFLKPGERALWDRVARTVTPLGPTPESREGKRQKAARSGAAPDSSEQEPPPTPAPTSAPAKRPAARPKPQPRPASDLDRGLRRRLARGVEPIDGRLDLHGMTQAEAHRALVRFIGLSSSQGRRVVLVITGKGRGGEDGGVLRRAVPHWLASRELHALVVSHGPAHHIHGGDGALYVRLRSRRRLGP